MYNMRIFITGGTGLVGRQVIKQLAKTKHDLLLLTRKTPQKLLIKKKPSNLNIIQGNLSNTASWQTALNKFNPQTVIHMAWEDIPDYSYPTSVKNLRCGLNLLEALTQTKCQKIIITGSCWEYGEQSGRIKEDAETKLSSAFAAAKIALYWTASAWAQENKRTLIWARLFYVYGPGQRENALIRYLINSVKTGQAPEIKNPAASNDFVYAGDVASAILALLKNRRAQGIYNIGSGRLTGIREIIATIYKNFNQQAPNQFKPSPIKSTDRLYKNFYADLTKIKQETNWQPRTSIKQGIKKMIL